MNRLSQTRKVNSQAPDVPEKFVSAVIIKNIFKSFIENFKLIF